MRLTELNQLVEKDKILDGTWKIGPNHEIQYRRRGKEQEAIISGEILAAEPTGLVIRVGERSTEEETLSRTLTLRGRWEADSKNRLSFLVERQSDRNDRLTLSGGWEIGGRNEILYRFKRIHLKTRHPEIHTVTFRGYWDLSDSRRLTYVLDKDSDSAFRFRGTFQTPTLQAKSGQIRYQLGVEGEGRRRVESVTIFGRWKLSRNLSLELEIPYPDRSVRPLAFGATYAIDSQNSILAKLTNRKGEPLGVGLLLTREFLKGQGEAFLRLRSSLQEKAAEAGVRFRW